MNKTAILNFILDEVALKCRNVSNNMRKRIHWMLKEKEVIVRRFDQRALILNGWIRVGRERVYISALEGMKKGVSNYSLETEEQFDRAMTLNNEVRCCSIQFKLTDPIEVESIEFLYIDQNNHNAFSKCSFNAVKHLQLNKLSTNQIKFILTRFKRIGRLKIYNCSLQKLDLTQSKIKQFSFWSVSFKEQVYLPKEIDQLMLRDCKSPNLIKARKMRRIYLSDQTDNSKKYIELIKTLKGVKVATINDSLKQCLHSLPSTIREIDATWYKVDNLEAIINQFPYLIEVIGIFAFQPTDKSQLRAIYPILEETEEKFNLRPRKIRVNSDNSIQLNNHSELFEKVEWVYIEGNKFNFDVLPSEIKKIEIGGRMLLESVTLNRLEKERE